MLLTKWKNKLIKSHFFDLYIGLLGRLIFLFVTPMIFTLLMFNPFLHINIMANSNEPQYISNTEIRKNLSNSFLAEFLQTSFRLGWYKICFENHGALTRYGRTVIPLLDDRGNIQIQYREELTKPFSVDYKILSAEPYAKPVCDIIWGNTDGITIGSSTASLGALINDMPRDNKRINGKEFETQFTLDFTKIFIYIKHDWRAYITKYLIILIFWSSLILLIKGIIKFLSLNNKIGN